MKLAQCYSSDFPSFSLKGKLTNANEKECSYYKIAQLNSSFFFQVKYKMYYILAMLSLKTLQFHWELTWGTGRIGRWGKLGSGIEAKSHTQQQITTRGLMHQHRGQKGFEGLWFPPRWGTSQAASYLPPKKLQRNYTKKRGKVSPNK